ncbi:phosphotransferase [Nonomuraea sp. NPDC050790]|uniref:phosphotransferase n=1 Tax=Nonomuraea sp. NPDC050790 TaxID=3364371 RepID=UPI00379BD242
MRHGYTNSTFGDGALVVKCYLGPGAAERLETERKMLRRMRGRVPVPAVQSVSDTSLTTRFVPGVHGQDLLDEGLAKEVMTACGRTLAAIHAMPAARGRVLVHGDYGPNNLIIDPMTHETAAVLDWEWAHRGEPVEDLAWCEWIIRTHHPEHVDALPYFFESYGGAVPEWQERHAAMLERCHALLAFAAGWGPDGEELWRERIAATAAFTG